MNNEHNHSLRELLLKHVTAPHCITANTPVTRDHTFPYRRWRGGVIIAPDWGSVSQMVMNGQKWTEDRRLDVSTLLKNTAKRHKLLAFLLGNRSTYSKPISWRVNSSCTAALYLFLKGLFETKREKKVVRRCTACALQWRTICLPLNSRTRQTKKQNAEGMKDYNPTVVWVLVCHVS